MSNLQNSTDEEVVVLNEGKSPLDLLEESISDVQEVEFKYSDRKLEITNSSDELERFEDLNPFQLLNLETVPYYLIPTMNDYPLVDFCHGKYYLIDGCNLVKEAIDTNVTTITCQVRYRGEMTEREMTSHKVGSRLRTPGGETSYSDHVRVLKSYAEYLLNTDSNLYLPIHGGDRRSADFNPDDNLINILVREMNKSKPVIEKLVRHGRYINDETLLTLAQNKAPRDFFDWTQPKKNEIISQFKTSINENLTDEKKLGISQHLYSKLMKIGRLKRSK